MKQKRGEIMETTRQPSKEMVREWLKAQIGQHRPPPGPDQIRRELGWTLKPQPR